MKSILVHQMKQEYVGTYGEAGLTKDHYTHTLETKILNKRKGKTIWKKRPHN